MLYICNYLYFLKEWHYLQSQKNRKKNRYTLKAIFVIINRPFNANYKNNEVTACTCNRLETVCSDGNRTIKMMSVVNMFIRRYNMTLLTLLQCSLSSVTSEQDCLYQIQNLCLYTLICSSSIFGFPQLPLSPFLSTANHIKSTYGI